jgi:hypothetical protein
MSFPLQIRPGWADLTTPVSIGRSSWWQDSIPRRCRWSPSKSRWNFLEDSALGFTPKKACKTSSALLTTGSMFHVSKPLLRRRSTMHHCSAWVVETYSKVQGLRNYILLSSNSTVKRLTFQDRANVRLLCQNARFYIGFIWLLRPYYTLLSPIEWIVVSSQCLILFA